MYSHILIPTDGSEFAKKAVTVGIKLAGSINARVTFLTVIEPFAGIGDRQHAFSGMPESVRQQALSYLDAEARRALDHAMATAKAQGVSADAVMVEEAEADHAIVATATSKGADLVVMGSHGRRGIKAALLGSVTQQVLAHSKVPVLVIR